MNKAAKTLLFLLFGGLIFMLVCVCVWMIGLVTVGIPLAGDTIGQPAAHLQPWEEKFLATYLAANAQSLRAPLHDTGVQLEFEVMEGETARDVVTRLQDLGFVRNGMLLSMYMRYLGYDRSIEAGSYLLNGSMNITELAQALQSAATRSNAITIIEGWRVEQIAQSLELLNTSLRGDELIYLVHESPEVIPFHSSLPTGAPLEGFLFPDTYAIDQEMNAIEFIEMVTDNFDNQVTPELRDRFSDEGLTLEEAITIASIVEREAVIPEERPLIAAVFLARLRSGMKLEADPTVQYMLGKQPDGSWWKSPLTAGDLAVDSPFNTYQYPGLPPAPIANPGLDSIRAVAYPAETSFLFFQAACDGSGRHNFASTFEEHLQNSCP
jgi:UPF0755 protein